jgi:hypothetical protein
MQIQSPGLPDMEFYSEAVCYLGETGIKRITEANKGLFGLINWTLTSGSGLFIPCYRVNP